MHVHIKMSYHPDQDHQQDIDQGDGLAEQNFGEKILAMTIDSYYRVRSL